MSSWQVEWFREWNNGGAAEQLSAVWQRLASLRNRLVIQPSFSAEIRDETIEELQSVLDVLQEAQTAIEQSSDLSEVEQLRSSLREKETLLREIHHRVKNNLQIVSSLLDLQMMRTRNSTVQTLLRSNQSRISAIALVHDRLHQAQDLSALDLGDYVQSLATTLVRTYALDPRRVALQTSVNTDIRLSPNYIIPIGLILNELISNALKHGLRDRPGEITVDLGVRQQTVTLSVSNTGDPLPIEFNQNSPESLGFQLLNSLVQQIDGSLNVERLEGVPGNDQALQTRVTVQFNLQSAQ